MILRRLYDTKLAQASYIVACDHTRHALVVDPNRDIAQYLDALAEQNLKLVAVTETHIHADFVSGSRELANVTRAKLYLSGEGDTDWQVWIKTGDQPLPLKLVIVDRTDPAQPAYVARLSWKLNPTFSAADFAFKPGSDEKQIRLSSVDQ